MVKKIINKITIKEYYLKDFCKNILIVNNILVYIKKLYYNKKNSKYFIRLKFSIDIVLITKKK